MTTAELPRTAAASNQSAPPSAAGVRHERRTDWLVGLGAALVALVLALIDLRIWNANLAVPFRLGGDADFYLMATDNVLKQGWLLRNPELGAPFGSTLYDLPQGADNLQYLIIKIIGALTGNDPALAVNLYFLATFPLVAGIGYGALRALRITRLPAAVFAVLYALMPYHFVRGTTHLLLSGYYMVPIGILLILTAVSDNPQFTRAGTWKPSFTKRSILPMLGCVAIASTGAYYAVFTLVLLVTVALADFAVHRRIRTLTAAAVTGATIGLVFLVNLAPSIVYWVTNGMNQSVAARTPQETERYGLRIAELIVPRGSHRIDTLARFEREISQFPQRSEAGMPLGLIGAVGFLGLLAVALILVAGHRHAKNPSLVTDVRRLSLINVVAVLVATMGGFSIVLSALGLRDIRSWNRMSIVIGFLALTAVAIVWDRLARPRLAPALAVVLVLAIGAIGVLDQTSPADAPDYSGVARTWNSDAEFTAAVVRAVPRNAKVFQLPFVAYPETAPVASIEAYDGARFAVHTDAVQWSFGAVTGRDVSWQPEVAKEAAPQMVDSLRQRGFAGIVVDRSGYADRAQADALVAELSAVASTTPLNSPNGRYAFIRIR